jgi:hypothetical protein
MFLAIACFSQYYPFNFVMYIHFTNYFSDLRYVSAQNIPYKFYINVTLTKQI